jgi:5-deoxy-glucuronate isomerase
VIEVRGRLDALLDAGSLGRIGAARSHGAVEGRTAAAVAWIVVERGEGELRVGDERTAVTGRASVFDGPGWSALVGPEVDFGLDGDVDATIVWRASTRTPTGTARIIEPDAVADEARGDRTTARRVRTYVAAGELIVGETLNPPGGWSSWPPHQHTHEEIYLYRFDPPHGFGIHADLAPGRGPRVVRDGDIVRIVDGEHPVVAAPGCAMYYLWALAGDTDTVDTRVDARFS